MVKKTTFLHKLPFDPHAPGEYYDLAFRGTCLDKANRTLPPWYFRAWHWHIERWVEPLYPTRIWFSITELYRSIFKGYRIEEMWGLDFTIAKFILPKIREFRRRAEDPDIMSGYPCRIDPCWPDECKEDHKPAHEIWLAILDDMVYAFECIVEAETNMDYIEQFQTDYDRVERGTKYFGEFLQGLWE